MALIQVRREDARATVAKLIATHRATLHDILFDGKQFWKDGADITATVKRGALRELDQCRTLLDALDRLDAGDIQEAAALCGRIEERIGVER